MNSILPNSWKWKTLREVATINYGKSASAILSDNGEIPVVGTGGVERYGSDYLYDGESIILGRKGTIDRVSFVAGKFWPIDTAYFLSDFQDDACVRWLYYFLQTVDLRSLNEATGVPSLSRDLLYKLRVPTPQPQEQVKIAVVISTLDRAIEQTEALIAKQQRIKTGLMQDLLTKGIDEHGNIRSESTHAFKDSPLGRIPVEWEVGLLDTLAERGSGHTPSKRRSNYWDGGIKWISLADSSALDHVHINTTEKEISALGIKNSSAVLHPAGTVVLSRDAGVGKSAVMECNMAVSQHFMAWRCGSRLRNYYLYYWLQRDKRKFEGIASGSTIVTIGLQFFKSYQIAHPKDVSEQIKIAEVLLEADEQIFRLDNVLQKLMHMKAGLMHDLLTGKRRVTPLLAPAAPQ